MNDEAIPLLDQYITQDMIFLLVFLVHWLLYAFLCDELYDMIIVQTAKTTLSLLQRAAIHQI
jgi:hypothetical protein